MSLTAFAAISASIILHAIFERQDSTIFDVVRVVVGTIFAVSGISAFALSLRSLIKGERSIIIWAAFVVGVFATTLIVAEFTLME